MPGHAARSPRDATSSRHRQAFASHRPPGARAGRKSTLARLAFPDHTFFDLEDPRDEARLLHSLLGTGWTRASQLAHPKVGASWETFCIEQLVSHGARRSGQ
ncbi:MAG TPA: hypothetical protein VGG39_36445 [Polyangiaceae bacterium]|jgi:hypothetical protein